jgi:prolyl-tRNA editing enzyme YbaK/EbsC (Cys-tRNA(Pro) deacylase)
VRSFLGRLRLPRIEPPHGRGDRSLELLDDLEPLTPLDHLLDRLVLVPGGNQEVGGLRTHALVVVERRLKPIGARTVVALAHELCLIRVEAQRALGDPLVDVAEDRLGRGKAYELCAHQGDNAERVDTVSHVLPEPVQRVADFLCTAQAEARLEEFPEGTPTVQDAAKALGVEPGQIVKTLVFVCDGRPVVALVPGDRRADGAKLARAVGADSARVATAEEVLAATGFPPGAVAPFPLPGVEAILLERTVLAEEHVWVGAGSERHLAGLRPAELLRLSRAQQMDAVEDRTYDSGGGRSQKEA